MAGPATSSAGWCRISPDRLARWATARKTKPRQLPHRQSRAIMPGFFMDKQMNKSAEHRFPIMDGDERASIPWAAIAPHEAQAMKNHNQSLERLAQRGGLCWSEAWGVMTGTPMGQLRTGQEGRYRTLVRNLVANHEAATKALSETESARQAMLAELEAARTVDDLKPLLRRLIRHHTP